MEYSKKKWPAAACVATVEILRRSELIADRIQNAENAG